jgi:hypothetical protein
MKTGGRPSFDCRQVKEISLYSTESRQALGHTLQLVDTWALSQGVKWSGVKLYSPIRLHVVLLN